MRTDMLKYMHDQLVDLQGRLDLAAATVEGFKWHDHFDLSTWMNQPIYHEGRDEKMDCGFTGCAIGWAAHERWFEQFGWSLSLTSNKHLLAHRRGQEADDFGSAPWHASFISIGKMFEFEQERTAYKLFSPDEYDNAEYGVEEEDDVGTVLQPSHVAERLKLLLDKGEDGFLERFPS